MLDSPPLALVGPIWILGALAAGLIVGSFANVCIHRLPRGLSVVTPRSRCPRCGAPIRARDNIPIVSYLVLLGRCRACRAPIPLRYPSVEAANGGTYAALASMMGPTPRTFVTMAFVSALLILSLIDLDHHILPNIITRPGILIGLAASFLPGHPRPLESFLASAAGYLALAAVAKAYLYLRGVEGLGRGDWKLVAMLGAFLGWEKMLLTVLCAAVGGTLVGLGLMVFQGKSSQYALPFGTFLGFAGIVVTLVGGPLLVWYRGLLNA